MRLFGVGEAQPLQDRRRARLGAPGVDIREPGLDLGDAGPSVAVSASASSAARSVSAARTVSISDTSLPGTSCATPPMRARGAG